MTPAPRIASKPAKRRQVLPTAAIFCTLLILPALAMLRLAHKIDVRLLVSYEVIASTTTYLLYRHDKKMAQAGGWRIPESVLHWAELAGGWPAAFLAQRIFRHKIAKVRFQVIFWMITVVHEFASFDFLHDWRYSKSVTMYLIR